MAHNSLRSLVHASFVNRIQQVNVYYPHNHIFTLVGNESVLPVDRSLWLGSAFRSWPTALYPLRVRAVDVMRRDPALVVSLCARSYRRSIRSQDGDLVSRIDFLRAARRPSGPFAPLSTASLLREQSSDPGAVYEVTCATEASK